MVNDSGVKPSHSKKIFSMHLIFFVMIVIAPDAPVRLHARKKAIDQQSMRDKLEEQKFNQNIDALIPNWRNRGGKGEEDLLY